LRYIVTNWSVY